jgi:NO-binding membrane sensor protein with MHYT domain
MNHTNPVLVRLSELPCVEPRAELTARIRAAALPKLELRKVHPLWSLAVAASVVGYLCWAVHFVAVISHSISS